MYEINKIIIENYETFIFPNNQDEDDKGLYLGIKFMSAPEIRRIVYETKLLLKIMKHLFFLTIKMRMISDCIYG